MEAGQTEVVVSQKEHIGMPNYSHAQILVSAKATCAIEHESEVDDYLAGITKAVIDNRSLRMFKALHAWAVNVPMEAPEFQATVYDVSAYGIAGNVELTFSMTERIGLPNYSNISIMSSRKTTVNPGSELVGFEYLFNAVEKKMAQRRGIVKQSPRPWVEQS